MALDDPTSLAVKQVFTGFAKAWWNAQINRRGADIFADGQVLPYSNSQPESVVVITWEEVESVAHWYEIVANRGTADEKRLGTAAKGAETFRFTAKKNADSFSAYTLPVSIRAKSLSDASAWVDVTVDFDPEDAPTEPEVTINFDANSADIDWVPAENGACAAWVTARGLGDTQEIAQWLVLPPKSVHKIGRAWGQFFRGDDYLLFHRALAGSPGRGRWDDYLRVFYPTNAAGFEFSVRQVFAERVSASGLRLTLGPEGSVSNDWTPTDTAYTFNNAAIRVPTGGSTEYALAPLANAESTFAITGGGVAWINLVGSALVITPTAAGVAAVTVTGTRTSDSTTKDAVITVTAAVGGTQPPVGPQPPSPVNPVAPVIEMSPSFLNNGFTYEQGQQIVIQFAAAGATEWEATGLPSGLPIDPATGRMTGAVAEIGRYTITLRARTEDSPWSEPKSFALKIIASASGINLAAFRFPWLAQEWKLTDLQFDLVSREVTSSRSVDGAVPIIRGDTTSLGLFCLLAGLADEVEDTEGIAVILRPLNNLGDAFILKTDNPAAVEVEGSKYYPIDINTTGGELQDALELAARKAPKGDIPPPLLVLAEIQLTVDGSVYSSRPFKAAIQLDAVR